MEKIYVLWGILGISLLLLIIVLFRYKHAFQWLGYLCFHVALAAFLLYIVNLLEAYTQLEIPINPVTVGTISVLGVPGLLMLVAMKLWIV